MLAPLIIPILFPTQSTTPGWLTNVAQVASNSRKLRGPKTAIKFSTADPNIYTFLGDQTPEEKARYAEVKRVYGLAEASQKAAWGAVGEGDFEAARLKFYEAITHPEFYDREILNLVDVLIVQQRYQEALVALEPAMSDRRNGVISRHGDHDFEVRLAVLATMTGNDTPESFKVCLDSLVHSYNGPEESKGLIKLSQPPTAAQRRCVALLALSLEWEGGVQTSVMMGYSRNRFLLPQRTLARRAAQYDPNSAIAHELLGSIFASPDRADSLRHLEIAKELMPEAQHFRVDDVIARLRKWLGKG